MVRRSRSFSKETDADFEQPLKLWQTISSEASGKNQFWHNTLLALYDCPLKLQDQEMGR